MTERLPPGVHPQALLLPWYLSATLAEAEQRDVTGHLATCPACRGELASLTRDRRLVRDALSDSPALARDLRAEVMRNVSSASARPSQGIPQRGERRGAWHVWPVWRAGLALAAALIVVQFLLILRLTQAPAPQAALMTRAVGSPTTRLQLVLNPDANEAALADFLRSLPARIVDGPTGDGAYIVEIPTVDHRRIAEELARARSEPQLIREASVLPH